MKYKTLLRSNLNAVLCASIIISLLFANTVRGYAPIGQGIPEDIQADRPFELIGHLGGAAMAITVEDHYAYVGFGPELDIFDIANPAAPVRLGSVLLYNQVNNIKVRYPYVYVADGFQGLDVVDISNRANPILTASLPITGWSSSIELTGNYLYIGDSYPGLRVYDISVPQIPVQVYSLEFGFCGMEVIGSYGYVAACGRGLTILNLSNPAVPSITGEYTFYDARSLAVSLPNVYLAGQSTIYQINVSDPTQPYLLGIAPIGWITRDISIKGRYAYVVASGCNIKCDGQVSIIDLQNRLLVKSSLSFPGDPAAAAIFGNYLFTTNGEYGGFRVVNIASPTSPKLVYLDKTPGNAVDIKIGGSYAYVADRLAGLRVVNVSNPSSPAPVGFVDLPGEIRKVSVNDQYAYVTATDSGLRVVNISNPAKPSQIGSDTSIENTWGVASSGTNVYFGGSTRFQIDSVSNPNTPGTLGFLPTNGAGVLDVLLQGNYAFVGHGRGLNIVDIANPYLPTYISEQSNGAEGIYSLVTRGNYLYAAVQGGTYAYLGIYDITNLSAPVLITSQPSARIWDLASSGTQLFEATQYGLMMFDLGDPINPVGIGHIYLPSDVKGVTLANDLIYLADGYAGVFIFRTLQGSIHGKVVDSRFRPLQGYSLSLNSGALSATDIDGNYQFLTLEPGNYKITVQDPSHQINPPSRQVIIPPDAVGQDFMILPKPVETTLTPGITTTLSYSDMQGLTTEIVFPSDAVSEITHLSLTPTWAYSWPGEAFTGHAFDLEAYQNNILIPGFSFNSPALVKVQYSADDINLLVEGKQPDLWELTNDAWQNAATLCNLIQEPSQEFLLVSPICSTGKFGVFGPTNQVFLPQINR